MKKILRITAILILLVGIAILCYPTASNFLYKQKVKKQLTTFDTEVSLPSDDTSSENTGDTPANELNPELEALYKLMQAENKRLFEEGQSGLKDAFSYETSGIDLRKYGLSDNNVGFLNLPKIGVTLPIYLGANNANMKAGAAQLTNTSYPIGGDNTNSVIAGHRGYARADMFRNIDQLEPGDKITIQNFRETLTYKVTNTIVILPNEIDKVLIQKGRDMVTLVSCTPLGQNHHRIIVYCDRVPNDLNDAGIDNSSNGDKIPEVDMKNETNDNGVAVRGIAHKLKNLALILILILCIIAITITASHIMKKKKPANGAKYAKEYENILTSEEMNKWKTLEVADGKAFIELNTRIDVAEEAKIRLINPPYSDFIIQIRIVTEDEAKKGEELELYKSKKLQPGTVLPTVKLSQKLPTGEHEAKVIYTFYNQREEEQAHYTQKVTLVF
jgi:sortase A